MQAPQPLVGRYRFVRTFQGAPSGAIWLASDTVQDRTVVAATVSGPRSRGLKRIVGLGHPNLATVLEFVDKADPREVPSSAPLRPGTAVAVAEYIAGQTFHERLETGAVSPQRAVLWMVHIAAALAAIHGRGGVHGALSPRSIVVARTGGGTVPVLTNLRAIANGAYCSPERVQGGGPSAQDDAWALHATLYTAVTGAAPFGGRTREQVAQAILSESAHSLADHGVDDPALQGILSRGLDRQPGRRPRTVADLGRELTAWLATQANIEPDGSSGAPPTDFLPRSIPPPPIDDEAVAAAAVRDLPPTRIVHDVTALTRPDATMPEPQVLHVPEAGDLGVLSALTTKLHPPEIASLMDAMAKRSPSDAGQDDQDDDDETAIMSAPELEGLRQQVFRADRLVNAPPPRAPEPPQEPAHQPAVFPAPQPPTPPAVAPPAQLPFDRRAVPPSTGDWPARSLFDSMTDEVPLPTAQAPVDIVPPVEPSAPLAFPRVAAEAPAQDISAAAAVPTPPATAPAPAPPKRGRAGLWITVALLIAMSIAVSALLAVKYKDRLHIPLPGLRTAWQRSSPPPSPPSPPTRSARPATPATAPRSAPAASSAPAAENDAASPEASASASPPASASAASADDAPACVKSFFPSDTFVREVPLDYVCDETNPGTVAISLHRMLVRAGAGSVTGGMKIWSGLAWYELPIVVILRRSCCVGAPPLDWPAAQGSCPALGPLVDGIVASRGDASSLKAAEQAYEDAIRCYFTAGLPRPFRYSQLPAGPNRAAFEGFCRANTR